MNKTIDFLAPTEIFVRQSPDDPNYFLSNDSPFIFTMDGSKWKSVTQYLVFNKFYNESIRSKIKKARSPYIIKKIESLQKYQQYKKEDIDEEDILYDSIKAKFEENPKIKRKLIDTDPLDIVIEGDELSSSIIENIRDVFVLQEKNKKKEELYKLTLFSSLDFEEVYDNLTSEQEYILESIENIVNKLMKKYSKDVSHKHYLGAGYNIVCPPNIGIKYITSIFSEDGNRMFPYLPETNKLFFLIRRKINLLHPELTDIEKNHSAKICTQIIRWIQLEDQQCTLKPSRLKLPSKMKI